jgi:hypothetical protein
MPRPRGEAEVRSVTLSVKVTEADAARLYNLASRWEMPATDVHRAALKRYLDAESEVSVLRPVDDHPLPAQISLAPSTSVSGSPEPPVETSPKVVHRHKPGPTPVTERYVQGVRMVTLACMVCGEVLNERRA